MKERGFGLFHEGIFLRLSELLLKEQEFLHEWLDVTFISSFLNEVTMLFNALH